MELPSFLDEDIIHSLGFWLLTLGTMIAFLLGFKGADTGLFGISEQTFSIPLITKILLILITPILAYVISLKFFK